jgi:hypothetical protein
VFYLDKSRQPSSPGRVAPERSARRPRNPLTPFTPPSVGRVVLEQHRIEASRLLVEKSTLCNNLGTPSLTQMLDASEVERDASTHDSVM